eukprot:s171_g20.t1
MRGMGTTAERSGNSSWGPATGKDGKLKLKREKMTFNGKIRQRKELLHFSLDKCTLRRSSNGNSAVWRNATVLHHVSSRCRDLSQEKRIDQEFHNSISSCVPSGVYLWHCIVP